MLGDGHSNLPTVDTGAAPMEAARQPTPPLPAPQQLVRGRTHVTIPARGHQATPPKDPATQPVFSAALQFSRSDPVKHPFAGRTSEPDNPPPLPVIKPTTTLRLEDSARSMEGLTTPLLKTMPSQPSGGLHSPASGSQPNPLGSYLAAAAAAGYDIPDAVLKATQGSYTDSDVNNILYERSDCTEIFTTVLVQARRQSAPICHPPRHPPHALPHRPRHPSPRPGAAAADVCAGPPAPLGLPAQRNHHPGPPWPRPQWGKPAARGKLVG